MKIERFEDIEGWQLGRELAKMVYRASSHGPFARDFALKGQIQGASGSVMHNIAEGFDAGSNLEFIRFLGYAKRSCTEVQSQLYLALDQKYVTQDEFDNLYRMAKLARSKIGAFMKYLAGYERAKSASKRSQPRTENQEP
jgi:four helix bundle protein